MLKFKQSDLRISVLVLLFPPRLPLNKRSLSGSHSSHSNLSQLSVASDVLGGDDADGQNNGHHAKIAERRFNGGADIQGTQLYLL